MAEDFTAKFRIDITDLKKGIQEANKQINLANAQFKAASAGMENWAKTTDGVRAKISQLGSILTQNITKLENYESQLKEQKRAYEENGKRADQLKAKLEQLANQGVKKTSEEYRTYKKALTDVTKEQSNNEKAARDLEITILNQKATIASAEKEVKKYKDSLKELEEGEKKAEKNTNMLTTAIGTMLGNLGTDLIYGAINAIKKLGQAVVDVGKQAISSYADYEQLVGGVETLFKDSAGIVENYANNAYKTAGLSANEYMETVTGFSASLLQSLGQDTEKSAHYADMAITDMSDNANKMGTSMSEIQHAYQGFAKQNYTMLDNLKLGYGGTKSEMERLIADANRVKEANGEMADLSIDSFADVTEAIHIIQTEMGITGTTAKEASTTIQGSASSMKSAWQNLLTGIADENQNFEKLVENFADSVVTYMSNMFPRVQQVLSGMTKLFKDHFPELMKTFYSQISDGIADMASQGTELVMALLTALIEALPLLIDGGVRMIGGILEGIGQAIPDVVKTVIEVIPQIVQGLVNGLPDLINGAVELLMGIVEAVPIIIPTIIDALPTIIDAIVNGLIENIPILLEGAIKLFMALVEAIPEICIQLATAVPEIISTILETLAPLASDLGDFFSDIWLAIKEIFAPVGEWFNDNVVEPIKEFFSPLVQWFTDLFKSIWDYISSVFEVIGQLAEGCVTVIKTAWGIVSDWFNQNVVQPVQNFFSDMWSGVKRGASEAWTGIKNVFKPVAEWFETKFKNAWKKVKDVFSTGGKVFDGIKEGITKAFKTVVNAIIGGINKVIATPFNAINKALDKIRKVNILGVTPFSGLGSISVPQIPKLATGGVLKRGQIGLLEGSGAEAVVPLERNKKWIKAVADDLLNELKVGASAVSSNNISNNKDYNFTQIINAPKQPSRIELYRQTRNLLSYAQQGSM